MLGHFSNDMQAGVLPMLFPLMKLQFGLSNAELGLVTLAFTAGVLPDAAALRLLLGYPRPRWFVPVTLIWGAVCAACYGFVGSYAAFPALAALGGVGSGAFHPLGASNAAAVSSDEHRNAAMSWYTVAGSFGYGLGPIVGTLVLTAFGVRGTVWLVIPGL